ncbi:MAG: S24 family peptidase [bacterium]
METTKKNGFFSEAGRDMERKGLTDFGLRLRMWMDKNHHIGHGAVSETARQLEVGESTLRNWLYGPSQPTLPMLQKLAGRMRVRLEWLARGEGDMLDAPGGDLGKLPEGTARVPRVRSVRAIGPMGVMDVSQIEGWDVVDTKCSASPQYVVALRCEDDGMSRLIPSGALLFVDPTATPERCDGHIIVIANGDKHYLRRLRHDAHGTWVGVPEGTGDVLEIGKQYRLAGLIVEAQLGTLNW